MRKTKQKHKHTECSMSQRDSKKTPTPTRRRRKKNASAIVERSICAIFESCKNNDLKSQPVINHRIVGSFLHLSEEQQLVSTSVVAGGQLTFVNVFKVEL